MTGTHREIYFNDFRKTVPSKLRIILRQPVIATAEPNIGYTEPVNVADNRESNKLLTSLNRSRRRNGRFEVSGRAPAPRVEITPDRAGWP